MVGNQIRLCKLFSPIKNIQTKMATTLDEGLSNLQIPNGLADNLMCLGAVRQSPDSTGCREIRFVHVEFQYV